jgi:glycosyltransferase involved in cell wall biosynthesis
MVNTSLDNPRVSIIIPTKNSSKTLAACLDSVANQYYKNVEILVIDNYSTDSTIEIARRYTSAVYTFGPERSFQINYGAKMASGKYIYRVDSDFVLEPNVISDAVNEAETNDYGAIIIHNTSDPTVSFWAKVRKFERDMYDSGSDELKIAVRFVRKDAFLSVGGFDTRMISGEDYDLHNRIIKKFDIGRIRAKEVHLGEYKSLGEVVKVNYFYGKNTGLFLRIHKSRGLRQVSPFRKVYLRNYKKFLRHPVLGTGFVVYQIVKYSSAAIGLLVGKK